MVDHLNKTKYHTKKIGNISISLYKEDFIDNKRWWYTIKQYSVIDGEIFSIKFDKIDYQEYNKMNSLSDIW